MLTRPSKVCSMEQNFVLTCLGAAGVNYRRNWNLTSEVCDLIV